MCKLLILFITVSLLIACYTPKSNQEKIQFSEIVNQYFIKYDPIMNPSIMRPGNSLAEVLIDKNKLNKNEMNSIKEKLKKNGWKEVENSKNYSFYCLNGNQGIGILFPELQSEFNHDNIKINYSDFNSWSIALYYQSFGVHECQ